MQSMFDKISSWRDSLDKADIGLELLKIEQETLNMFDRQLSKYNLPYESEKYFQVY